MTTLLDILFLLISATGGSLAMGLIWLLRTPVKVPVSVSFSRLSSNSRRRNVPAFVLPVNVR